MPILTINTNVASKDIPKNLKSVLTNLVADSLCKPKSYVAIHIKPDQDISFGDSEQPAALCELMSIGALSVENNKKYSKEISNVLSKELKIPSDRTYISFNDVAKGNCGYDGTTFAALM